ncbi:MAG: hypothetical protein ACR2P3_07380 [Geminicoccaceae bacterium]
MSRPFAKGTALWALAAIGLSGFIARGLTQAPTALPNDVAAPAVTEAVQEPEETDMTTWLPSDDLVDRIVARPVFSASRRLAPLDTPPGAARRDVIEDKPALELIGTLRAGDDFIALLKHPSKGLLRRRPGQKIGDWDVVDVQDRHVSLESKDGVDVLVLREDRSPPAKRRIIKKGGEIHDKKTRTPERPVELPPPAAAPTRRPI